MEQVVHLAVMMDTYSVMVVMFMAMINHDCYVDLPVHMLLLMMMVMMSTCPQDGVGRLERGALRLL